MPILITTLLPVLIQVVLQVLQSEGVTTPGITALITSLESTLLPLVTQIQSGQATSQTVLASFAALSGVLNVLKQQTSLPAATLNQIEALSDAIQAAIAAYLLAAKGVDVDVLTPIDHVPVTS